MHQVKIVDHSFRPSVSPFYPPRTMRWVWVGGEADLDPGDTVVYTNRELAHAAGHRVRRKVAWLLESLSEDDYHERIDAVRANHELCLELLAPEDWMVRHTDLVED